MQTPEVDSLHAPLIEAPEAQPAAPRGIAPAWHTAILIVAIIALSVSGTSRLAVTNRAPHHLFTYGATAVMDLVMLGWVALGLRLRRVPFGSLFGSMTGGIRGFALDAVIALAFWIAALSILGSLGGLWNAVEYAAAHRHSPTQAGQALEPSASQKRTLQTLERLAPNDGREIAAWVVLCCIAGLIEEAVFRGYLQQQFIAWGRGRVAVGVVFSALLFGAAHGYQGIRNMVLLAVFGVLFSLLAIFRRSLRAGILAHSWHDLIAGLALAFVRSHHLG